MEIFGPPNIGKMKAKQDVNGLIKALRYKKNSQVRGNAARVLGEIGDPRAVEPLIDALMEGVVDDLAASALGEIGDPRAVETLLTLLEHESAGMRGAAASALGEIGDPRAVDPLINALGSEDYAIGVRWHVIDALGKLGDTRAVEPLTALLRDKADDTRLHAARALGKIGDTRAIDPLTTAQKDKYGKVRRAATAALKKLQRKSLSPLASEDKSKGVRKAAAETPARVGAERAADTNLEKSSGNKKGPAVEQVSNKGVTFDRMMKRDRATYELYTADDAEKAKDFLLKKKETRKFYYVEVETPNGTWGIDKDGMYLDKLLPWQKKLSLGKCEGEISTWPSMHSIMVAGQGLMDNAVAGISCGKCLHKWWDGIRLNKSTIVRCPMCKTYNKIKGGEIQVTSS